MIKEYKNGEEFINENIKFLELNIYESLYFVNNAKLLNLTSKENYAIKCINGDKKLLILKVSPYNALICGDSECINELFNYLYDNDFEIYDYLASKKLGDIIKNTLNNEFDEKFYCALSFDFMEAKEITEESDNTIEKVTVDDLDEIVELIKSFVLDTGIKYIIDKEKILKDITNYRVIKQDGIIASMAKFSQSSDEISKISNVYTREQYRNRRFARKIVNSIKNEVINSGKIATLNVEQKNPISNHIYSSIGFNKIRSHAEYRRS